MYNLNNMSDSQTLEILKDLKTLPSDKVEQVREFIAFLRERYGKNEIVDESDEWTDEDLDDFAVASFTYFEQTELEEEVKK